MEERVVVDGAELWTVRSGSGPPLVLCHGGPGLWDDLGAIAAMVDDLVSVHRYDQRGAGRSSGGPPFTVARFVDDLEALRAHFGHESWIVGGHSWGASLALAYAVAHPARVSGLVYVCGTGIGFEWREEFRRNRVARLTADQQRELEALDEGDRRRWQILWSTDFADRARGHELAGRLLHDGLEGSLDVNAAVNADWQRFTADNRLRPRLAGLEVPALVVSAEADPRPLWAQEEVASLLPRATLARIERSGHYPWLEQPKLFRAALRGFLRGFR